MSNDMLSPHTALVYIMVLVSAADRDMTDQELRRMGDIVRMLPVFDDFNEEDLVGTAEECASRLSQPGGLDAALDLIVASLPSRLAETAYAIACEVAAADLHVEQEEMELLQMLRYRLDVDRLTAAAIERGARARHTTL